MRLALLFANRSSVPTEGPHLPGNKGSVQYSLTVGIEAEIASRLEITREETLEAISISRLVLPKDEVLGSTMQVG